MIIEPGPHFASFSRKCELHFDKVNVKCYFLEEKFVVTDLNHINTQNQTNAKFVEVFKATLDY